MDFPPSNTREVDGGLFSPQTREVDGGLAWHNLITSESLLESSHMKYKEMTPANYLVLIDL